MRPLPPETARATDRLSYWCHIFGPLDMWSVYEVLTDGLIQAKRDYRDALVRHDDGQAARQLAEVRDLTALCAAAAEGIALTRLRYLDSDRPWPLVRL